MVDIKINLGGLELKNPVIPASGTFGYGREYADIYDINLLGSFVTKGTTLESRYGNEQPRIAECESGMLNSVGLQNPGIDWVIEEELPNIADIFQDPVIVNISGFSIEEYALCAEKLCNIQNVGILEVNVSCPNVKDGGIAFGQDPKLIGQVVRAVKERADKPIFVKLSPNVTDIVEMAVACEEAGADGISLINTLLGMRIDIKTRKPILNQVMGGFSGPAVFPVALRMVYQVCEAVNIPVIGMGGISKAEDIIEMMMAGATAVQVGSENLRNPFACKDMIEQMPVVMKSLGIDNLQEIIGIARK